MADPTGGGGGSAAQPVSAQPDTSEIGGLTVQLVGAGKGRNKQTSGIWKHVVEFTPHALRRERQVHGENRKYEKLGLQGDVWRIRQQKLDKNLQIGFGEIAVGFGLILLLLVRGCWLLGMWGPILDLTYNPTFPST